MATKTKAKALTAKGVEAIEADPVTRREIPDGGVAGLYLVVQPSGAKSWAVRYRHDGRPKKLTIGPFPKVSLAAARNKARAAIDKVALGDDPAAEAKEEKAAAKAAAQENPDRELVKGVVADFVKRHCAAKKDGAETARLLKKNVLPTLGEKRLDAVTRRDVVDLLDGIVDRGAPYTANRTFAAFRKCCNWAVQRGVIDASPCFGVKPPAPEVKRDRMLSDDEIRWLWKATEAEGPPFGALARMLLLTAQRREEVAAMAEGEIDADAALWTIPAARAKNGKAHAVPLSKAAQAVLAAHPRIKSRAGYIFTTTGVTPVSGFGKAKARIDARMIELAKKEAAERRDDPEEVAIPAWRFHDLRRTAASGMARCGVSMPVVEKLLNHISGSFGGVAGVYQRHSFADEMRHAVEAWAALVAEITGEGAATKKVVRLRRTRAKAAVTA